MNFIEIINNNHTYLINVNLITVCNKYEIENMDGKKEIWLDIHTQNTSPIRIKENAIDIYNTISNVIRHSC